MISSEPELTNYQLCLNSWDRPSRGFPSDHGRTRISLCQTARTTALCLRYIAIPLPGSAPGVLLLTAVLVGHADLLGYLPTRTILFTQRASVPG
ncbi:BZ3501_MvSof-1269-A2-R1_Chr12-3g03651 [Microbotryum saponariae]|nr:BZ3501_MvSof-1269-A2-R1_Chr12-3g03651 [Microbotryum saponariae]